MIKAYRDTWQLGVHSWLTYMRDRLSLAHSMLSITGSCFVQISDENLHYARCVMDEIFGPENCCKVISFRKTPGDTSKMLPNMCDYILWYAKDKEQVKHHKLFSPQELNSETCKLFNLVESPDGNTIRPLNESEKMNPKSIPEGWRLFYSTNLKRSGFSETATFTYEFDEQRKFHPGKTMQWKTNKDGLDKLKEEGWLYPTKKTLRYKRYYDSFPMSELGNMWNDTGGPREKKYVVQTSTKIVERCMLMTTAPGDLVLDPTCGSGTTAFVSEQLGRRWITCDTSRVPIAVARLRLLTAHFPYFQLKNKDKGPKGGFVYLQKKNDAGQHIGGIVPHITLQSLVNNELNPTEIIVDRPEQESGITRVCGPFCIESIFPPTTNFVDEDESAMPNDANPEYIDHVNRMLEILRISNQIRFSNNKVVSLQSITPYAKSLSLHAEAVITPPPSGSNSSEKGQTSHRVAIHIGPAHGSVTENSLWEAAKEAVDRKLTVLYVIGFSFDTYALASVEKIESDLGVKVHCITALADLLMGDLLKNTRSSKLFAVCGKPDFRIINCKCNNKSIPRMIRVKLKGLDVFDPATADIVSLSGDDVPIWMMDPDYDDYCFRPGQVFFPRTQAWENLKKALRAVIDEDQWCHLHSDTSASFVPGNKVAVKVIDDRGNEFMAVQQTTNKK